MVPLRLIFGVAFAIVAAAPVHAFELFGIRFFGTADDEIADAVIADPRTYDVELTTDAEGRVEDVIRNASALWQDRDEPASGVAGLLAKARGDYRRITAALYQEGYYGGAISILVAGREASALPPDAALPDPVQVQVRVNAGPQFRFGRLTIINRAPQPLDPAREVEAPEEVGFRMGDIARSPVVARAEERALDAWRHQSYAKAAIASRQVVADHATNTVDVTITIDPGRPALFGPVSVQGQTHMDPDFIVRQTGLEPGTPYDPDELERARERLARLDVFRSLRIEAAESIRSDGLLPFDVIVQEQALRRFGLGASFSTIDGAGVEGFWLHRNLFGQAERLRLDARVAGIGFPVETDEFDIAFGGTFTKPGIFTPDTDLVAAVSAERLVLPLYTELSVGAQVGLRHIFSDTITGEAGVLIERNRFEDQFGTRDFLTAGAYGLATFDNRDSTTDPTEGFYLSASLEPVYEFMYGNPIVRSTAEARAYFGFGEDRNFVLAGRVRAGALAGPALDMIPPDKLFFAGGGGSVRGYGFRSIGVENPDGSVTGGRYLLEASVEARARVMGDIGVVGFLDGGYVAADTFPDLDDLRLGAGVGLRYFTGLGPIRLDLAVPLNRRDGDPDYALYVGIGQAF